MRDTSAILTPSQVSQYIKGFMDRDRLLSGLLVGGERSNYKMYPSGHHYFTLKDGESALRCVMFRGDAVSLRFRPQNGMRVIAAGRITVFPRDGQYQLYCSRLTPDGAGDLHLAFEQLKQRLFEQGLFDQGHKKPIPAYPDTIALVTSPAGAAVRDMLRILGARWPLARVKVLPVRVQGEGAAEEIAAAIRWADRYAVADLIITGRGGGSMEDLWAFNDERVARAIADSHIPVISAVGHEPDVTISDFVADLRAATPSNAAELAVPDQTELRQHLAAQRAMLLTLMTRRLKQERQRVAQLAGARALRDPKNYIDDRRMQLDYTQRRLIAALQRLVAQQRERFVRLTSKLDAMSPLKVLSRGYSMTFDAQGHVVRSVRTLSCGDRITVRLADGRASAEVREIQEDAT